MQNVCSHHDRQVWLDCAALETTLACFKGLRDSLKKYSTQWQEYFKVRQGTLVCQVLWCFLNVHKQRQFV